MNQENADSLIAAEMKTNPITFRGVILKVEYNVLAERFIARVDEDSLLAWHAITFAHLRTRVDLSNCMDQKRRLQDTLVQAKEIILAANRNGFTLGQPVLSIINDVLEDTKGLR